MNKTDMTASMVEGQTTAPFPLLMEDEAFKKLFYQLIKSKDNIYMISKKLSDFAEKNLI